MATKTHTNPGPVFEAGDLQIGPVKWQVIPLHKEGTYGQSSSVCDHTIAINPEDVDDYTGEHLDTVFHEILHAMSATYFCRTRSQLTEHQVRQLGRAFDEFVLQNPKFISWLQQYALWQQQARDQHDQQVLAQRARPARKAAK